ncbi:MAG: hypothetical protein C5B60_04765 [Chloroflexi bacterium]|nr:MAG: hypothetical protein C5B60_04765 [Chloroflexota bacterium]
MRKSLFTLLRLAKENSVLFLFLFWGSVVFIICACQSVLFYMLGFSGAAMVHAGLRLFRQGQK